MDSRIFSTTSFLLLAEVTTGSIEHIVQTKTKPVHKSHREAIPFISEVVVASTLVRSKLNDISKLITFSNSISFAHLVSLTKSYLQIKSSLSKSQWLDVEKTILHFTINLDLFMAFFLKKHHVRLSCLSANWWERKSLKCRNTIAIRSNPSENPWLKCI